MNNIDVTFRHTHYVFTVTACGITWQPQNIMDVDGGANVKVTLIKNPQRDYLWRDDLNWEFVIRPALRGREWQLVDPISTEIELVVPTSILWTTLKYDKK